MNKLILKKILITTAALAVVTAKTLVTIMVIPFPLNFRLDEVTAQTNDVVYVDNGTETPFVYKSNGNGGYSGADFKILGFTDLHLDPALTDRKANNRTINMIKRNIDSEKPDLIVLGGDIITGAYNKTRAKGVADLLEKYGIYWAPVFGNHDTEKPSGYSRAELTELWSGYTHCLLKKGSVEGFGNYMVNIKTSENDVSQTLVFMDSGEYLTEEEINSNGLDKKKTQYDYIQPDQVQWYKDSLAAIAETYGDTKSLLFCHIPVPEYKNAYEEGEVIFGKMNEEVACSKINGGMFDAIKEVGSTQALFAGHDHINDFIAIYQEIYFVYLQPSGYSTYDIVRKKLGTAKDRIQGCTIVTVSADQSFSIEKKLNTRFA